MKEENDVRAGKVQSVTEILIELGFLKSERVNELKSERMKELEN